MMEYYYLGTESLWCGNWNHLACRRWQCEVDHPSQSTEVNLGKKQKWCSMLCPWSQVQQDTSGPDKFRILCCLWTIHHRCTCKWDWTEMLNVFSRREQRLYGIRFVWIQKDVGVFSMVILCALLLGSICFYVRSIFLWVFFFGGGGSLIY